VTTLGALCAAVVAAGPAGQEPGKPGGLYVKLSGAVLQQQDSDLASVGGIPLNATLEFDSGFGVHGAVGYTWSGESPVSVSLELEYSFRTANHETLIAPPLFIPATGTNESHSLMLNALASVEIAGSKVISSIARACTWSAVGSASGRSPGMPNDSSMRLVIPVSSSVPAGHPARSRPAQISA